MAGGASNVWTQMNYIPPRGQCNFKVSYLTRCPCLRYMLHPLKSSSSYDCDGCAHHASFHSMESRGDDEIRKRWEQEAKDRADEEEQVQQRPKKRVRAIEFEGHEGGVLEDANKGRRSASKNTRRAAGTRAKTRITDMAEGNGDRVIELD